MRSGRSTNYHHSWNWLKPGDSEVPTPKIDPYAKKVLLHVWWCTTGPTHPLPPNTTVTADLYCRQLDNLAAKLRKNLRKKMERVFFLHDNARPHVASRRVRRYVTSAGQPYPPLRYSPDMAPPDYLFRSLSHFLDGRQFEDDEELRSGLQNFFNEKSPEFYWNCIYDLPMRWQHIVDHDGAYIVD
ncbi:transposase [Oesophagostomum dentatum]|uniref:Transposase n=1 Tax=Oesophagostomum dentatum TaxID=61180 RepID=A0A0B1S9Q9_OESDE|nr:transposase [Oesophagostomum dentatum]